MWSAFGGIYGAQVLHFGALGVSGGHLGSALEPIWNLRAQNGEHAANNGIQNEIIWWL